ERDRAAELVDPIVEVADSDILAVRTGLVLGRMKASLRHEERHVEVGGVPTHKVNVRRVRAAVTEELKYASPNVRRPNERSSIASLVERGHVLFSKLTLGLARSVLQKLECPART